MVVQENLFKRHRRGALLALAVFLSASGAAQAALFEPDPPLPRVPLLGEFVRPVDRRVMLVVVGLGEAALPAGGFADHARAHILGGGGIGAEVRLSAQHAARLALTATHTRFNAKQAGLQGPVTLTPINLRADYLFGDAWWRPYFGVGVGLNPWHGKITQTATGLFNEAEGTPASLVLALGVDVGIAWDIALAPEVSWTKIGGDFNASLWRAGLALRWSI